MGKQTKVQEVCAVLTRMAQELGPDAKLPTVLQLRDRLGVSITTVHAVLDELETRQIVRRRHGVGIYVAPNIRQHRVCLICSPAFLGVAGLSPFWRMLVDQVRDRAESEREAFSFHFATDSAALFESPTAAEESVTSSLLPDALVEDIRQGRIDGILGVGLPQETVTWIEELQVPFVAYAGPGQYRCGVDNRKVVQEGTVYLAEANCARIGFWSAIAPYRFHPPTAMLDELPTFRKTLESIGHPFYPELVCDNRFLIPASGGIHTQTHQEQGYHAGMRIFGPETDPAQWPDGVLSCDDMLTLGLLTALQRLGIRPGETVKIATQTNAGSPVLLGWEDRLTRMEVNPAEIVNEMFDMLEALMHGETLAPTTVLVNPQLLVPEGVSFSEKL